MALRDLILKNKQYNQKRAIKILTGKKTLDKAVRGSMKKRNALLERVEMSQSKT